MMRCDDVRPQLSLLADGHLSPAAQTEVRVHVDECDDCRGLLGDLVRLRDTARTLGPLQPPDHVWLEVAGQIRLDGATEAASTTGDARRSSTRQWIGLAAAIVITTLGAYAVSRVTVGNPAPTSSAGATSPSPGVEAVVQELGAALEKALVDLQTLARDGDRPAESKVAAALLENLAIVDRAIAESRTALAQDPSNAPARDSLIEALRQKVDVLQSTMVLINDMRLGNAEGAARAAAGLDKKS